jgi:hypothetical protein
MRTRRSDGKFQNAVAEQRRRLKNLKSVISNQLQVLMHQTGISIFFLRYLRAPRKYRIAITVVFVNHYWGHAHEITGHQTLNRD